MEPDLTRSELERRFLRLCRRHGLPKPEVNVRVGSFEIDFLWRDRSVVVETDGYRFHRGRVAFESDRARDAELKLLGYDVLRFTHRQVAWEASLVARTLRTLLS
jgi:very-short-patch-repair endonuclease